MDAGFVEFLNYLFVYLDSSFTAPGGHSRHILRRLSGAGRLIAFDVDGLLATRWLLEIVGFARFNKKESRVQNFWLNHG